MMDPGEEIPQPVELPIDGVLDLHTFRPSEIGDLVPSYLQACRERGILQVRVVHGKGIGNLKRSVRSILACLPEVISFDDAGAHYGGSGATIVNLRPKDEK
jgi:DNA-nicking Smr family endonuclease